MNIDEFIPVPGGESKLTTAALLRHDAVQGGLKFGAGEEDDVTGVTHKTFDTFASDWSGCTNVAFDKVSWKLAVVTRGGNMTSWHGEEFLTFNLPFGPTIIYNKGDQQVQGHKRWSQGHAGSIGCRHGGER